jgi:hypothetical protein
MEKLTDQELDALFKSAAEGIKPEYDGAAWEGMNERLNVPAKSPSIINKWLPLSILGLVIFSGGVWIGYTLSYNSSDIDTKKEEQLLTESKTVSVDSDNRNVSEKTIQQEKANKDGNQISNSVNGKSKSDQTKQSFVVAKPNSNDRVVEKYAGDADRQTEDQKMESDSHENEFISASNLQQVHNDANKLLPVEESNSDSISIAKIEAQETDSTKLDSKQDNKERAPVGKGIFIRGLASPDFTSVDFGSAGETGSNYALLIEYQFNNRWSVSTGAIRSFKKYSSNGEITYSGRTADNLDGACRILDIPLNVYYRLKPLSKTSFFVGAGLSSYIMLSEDYTYTVYTSNGDRVYSKQVEKENNELFKVLNLSVGVQHQLNSRLFLQVEPFLKAPLAGVGYGDVRLSSLGVFFGIKYKLK